MNQVMWSCSVPFVQLFCCDEVTDARGWYDSALSSFIHLCCDQLSTLHACQLPMSICVAINFRMLTTLTFQLCCYQLSVMMFVYLCYMIYKVYHELLPVYFIATLVWSLHISLGCGTIFINYMLFTALYTTNKGTLFSFVPFNLFVNLDWLIN